MAQVNIYVDDDTLRILQESAKQKQISLSRHINHLIQRALILGEDTSGLDTLLAQDKFIKAFQKQLQLTTEIAPLLRYLVKNLNKETTEEHDLKFLLEAKNHAEGYVAGLFEE